jgi:hypothetical protein
MTQGYDNNESDRFDDDEDEDFFIDPYPIVSLELPPPHLDALRDMLSRIVPENEIEAEVRTTLLEYQLDAEFDEIRELAEFRSVLEHYAEKGSEYEA